MDYWLGIGIQICIYIILVLSANLTVGMANLMTMCQAAFYGIGAYVGAVLLKSDMELPFIAVALIVMLATGLSSLLVSLASARLKGDYFVLGTIGFQMVVYSILNNWENGIMMGSSGIDGIPRIKLLCQWGLDDDFDYLIFALVMVVLVAYVLSRIQQSPYGRTLKAIRRDELSAQALGRNVNKMKISAFFISAAFSGLAGLIYASFIQRVNPDKFTLDTSVLILTALFIGGIGKRVWGPVLGAIVVVILPVLLRRVGLPQLEADYLRPVIYGVGLVLLMYFRPQGLLGDEKLK